jgi:hypothetical protein
MSLKSILTGTSTSGGSNATRWWHTATSLEHWREVTSDQLNEMWPRPVIHKPVEDGLFRVTPRHSCSGGDGVTFWDIPISLFHVA